MTSETIKKRAKGAFKNLDSLVGVMTRTGTTVHLCGTRYSKYPYYICGCPEYEKGFRILVSKTVRPEKGQDLLELIRRKGCFRSQKILREMPSCPLPEK